MTDSVTERLVKAQQKEEVRAKTVRALYALDCFETLTLDGSTPLCMRVPGGWIFYAQSGGGSMQMSVADDLADDNPTQIIGHSAPATIPVFVPFSLEFEGVMNMAGRE